MRAVELPWDRGWAPVAWATPLVVLQPAALEASPAALAEATPRIDGLGAAACAFTASIDGQFYRRATPDAPPFVSEGDVLRPGQVVGLIEVMKFFYDVNFDSPIADPAAAYRIVKIVAANATPLRSGDPVAYVVPVAHLPH